MCKDKKAKPKKIIYRIEVDTDLWELVTAQGSGYLEREYSETKTYFRGLAPSGDSRFEEFDLNESQICALYGIVGGTCADRDMALRIGAVAVFIQGVRYLHPMPLAIDALQPASSRSTRPPASFSAVVGEALRKVGHHAND